VKHLTRGFTLIELMVVALITICMITVVGAGLAWKGTRLDGRSTQGKPPIHQKAPETKSNAY